MTFRMLPGADPEKNEASSRGSRGPETRVGARWEQGEGRVGEG